MCATFCTAHTGMGKTWLQNMGDLHKLHLVAASCAPPVSSYAIAFNYQKPTCTHSGFLWPYSWTPAVRWLVNQMTFATTILQNPVHSWYRQIDLSIYIHMYVCNRIKENLIAGPFGPGGLRQLSPVVYHYLFLILLCTYKMLKINSSVVL